MAENETAKSFTKHKFYMALMTLENFNFKLNLFRTCFGLLHLQLNVKNNLDCTYLNWSKIGAKIGQNNKNKIRSHDNSRN